MNNGGVKNVLVKVNPVVTRCTILLHLVSITLLVVIFNARFSEYCHDNVATSVE